MIFKGVKLSTLKQFIINKTKVINSAKHKKKKILIIIINKCLILDFC